MRGTALLALALAACAAADDGPAGLAADALSNAELRPNVADTLRDLAPPGGLSTFVVPVSIHRACKDASMCVHRKGTDFSAPLFGRLLARVTDDFRIPADGFSRTGFEGVSFAVVHVDDVVSPQLYDWSDADPHDAIVDALVQASPSAFDGYLNVFVTGEPLSGVAGIDQALARPPRVFVGADYMQDDDPRAGLFGGHTLSHEIMHVMGMGHVADGTTTTPLPERVTIPTCQLDFTYILHPQSIYLPRGADGMCVPDRNNLMAYGDDVSCGRPTFYTKDDSSNGAAPSASPTVAAGRAFFEPQYGRVMESLIACWAYRNFVVAAPPIPVTRYPLLQVVRPAAGAVASGSADLAVDVVDDGGDGSPPSAVSVTVDGAALPMTLQGADTGATPPRFHYVATPDVHGLANGRQELALEATAGGIVARSSAPVLVLNPTTASCVRIEACIDGTDTFAVAGGALTLNHQSGSAAGRHPDCRRVHALTAAGASLFDADHGVVVVDGHPIGSDAASWPTSFSAATRAHLVDGPGTVTAASGAFRVDDAASGAHAYVLDLCAE